MYNRNQILALESNILFIFVYYSNIQISLNTWLQNPKTKTLDILDIAEGLVGVNNKINVMRNILFKLVEIKPSETINYNEVTRRLYHLGSLARGKELHSNNMVWDDILSIIERDTFSAVFDRFIYMLRNVETKFTNLKMIYQEVSFMNIQQIQRDLLQLGSYLQEFISYVEAVKIMLDYIKKEQIFEQASHDKNFIKPQRIKPVLQIVKGS